MLSEGGNANGRHLRRAKSASSVQQRRSQPLVQEPIDPETARSHALIAANRAMERSSERASDELRRSRSNTSRHGEGDTPRSQNVHFSAAAELSRQRSLLKSQTTDFASTLHVPSDNIFTDLSQYTAPPAYDFGVKERYGSEPSSYKRLRKARSMITPRRRAVSGQERCSQSPTSTGRTLRRATTSIGLSEDRLKIDLKRSMSFLRTPTNMTRIFKRPPSEMKHRDEAVRLAREQFQRDLEEQKITPKPSLLSHPKIRRQKKAFRKSVRSTRLTEFGDGVKSGNQPPQDHKAESKFRSFSASVRDKFIKVLGMSLPGKEKLPIQQLDATRNHFGDCVDGSGVESAFDNYHVGDCASLSRASIYVPTYQEDETYEDLDKMSKTLRSAASRESLHSTTRSRVTSWSNSTTTGSLGMRSTAIERKRLSIIKEDGGPHQPSSSAGRHLGGVSSFTHPLRTQDSVGNPISPVDSQRVYSALIKRIDEEQAEVERTQHAVANLEREQAFRNDHDQVHRIAPTIRPVQSEMSLRSLAPDTEHRQFSLHPPSWHEDSCMTPQKVFQHHENIERRKKQLVAQESQSKFFPFSSEAKPKTPSPFKLAMQQQRLSEVGESDAEAEEDAESVVHHHPQSEKLALGGQCIQGRFGMSSESVYSRTTNGGTNPKYMSPMVLSPEASTEDVNAENGMVTIIPTRVSRAGAYGGLRPPIHQVKTSERGEWKGWMENQFGRKHSTASSGGGASQGHFREMAQIDGDDSALRSGAKVEVSTPTAFTSSGLGSFLKRRSSSIKINPKFPLLDLKEVPRNNTPQPRSSNSMTCSQIGLMSLSKQKSLGALNDENKRMGMGESLRKISPRNISHMLRGKKSQAQIGKGKWGGTKSESPPVSTPGRLVIPRSRNGDETSSSPLSELTPTGNGRSHGIRPKTSVTHFSENKNEHHGQKDLSRLSRPFDMDCPEGNRPFDSMYLGKAGLGFGECGVGSKGRLSVAPRAMGFGTMDGNFEQRKGSESPKLGRSTALPTINTGGEEAGNTKTESAMMGAGTRRMVSNFLKNRRKNAASEGGRGRERDASGAAFI